MSVKHWLVDMALVTALTCSFARGEEPQNLERKLSEIVISTVKKWYKKDTVVPANQVRLEQIKFDQSKYAALTSHLPQKHKELSEKFAADSKNVWQGFAHVGTESYAVLVRTDLSLDDPSAVRMMDLVSPLEEEFVRRLKDLAYVLPISLADKPLTVEEFISVAVKEPKYGKHVVPAEVRKALSNAGPNAEQFLLGAASLTSSELPLAATFLYMADGPEYGFGGTRINNSTLSDLQTMHAQDFVGNIRAAQFVLDHYEWARKLAQKDFVWYSMFVLSSRASEEYNTGRIRPHLAQAVQLLLKNCTTIDQAVERIVNASRKLFKYGSGFGQDDGSVLDMLIRGQGRCEEMADMGISLLRVAGVPAGLASVPWWADGDDNHAWVNVLIPEQDNTIRYTFLTGDREVHADGSYNIKTYNKENPLLRTIWHGKELQGIPGCPKVIVRMYRPDGSIFCLDETRACTTTTDLTLLLDKDYAGTDVGLCVFNSGGFKSVVVERVKEDGMLHYKNVGCIPRTDEKTGIVGEGLLYAMVQLNEKRIIGVPFNLAPDGKTIFGNIADLYNLPLPVSVQNFLPNTSYYCKIWTSQGFQSFGTELVSDAQGILQLPVKANDCLLMQSSQVPLGRPYFIRKQDDTFIAQKH